MRNHAHDCGGHATTSPNAHIRLGWMDARSWYQLTTLVNISHYMDSTHTSSYKYIKGDGMKCTLGST